MSGLMLRAQEVVDGFDGVEGRERHFDHDGVPVAHGAVPEAWQLQSLQFLAVLALVGNEACSRVNKVGQVKLLTLVVADGVRRAVGPRRCLTTCLSTTPPNCG